VARRAADDDGLRARVPAGPRWRAAAAPAKRFRRWLFNGARPEPVPSYLGPVEDPKGGRAGICCSGGGIRSAAFSLGALQALQRAGELKRAKYLAAVSGGSYIAAAISTVARDARLDDPCDPNAELFRDCPPFAPGSPEEEYLRDHCSYLAPTAGDKLFLAWRIVLGLLLNLLFISLPLIGIALVLTGFLYAPFVHGLAGPCSGEKCAATIPLGFWLTPAGVLAIAALAGAVTLLFRWRADRWERFFGVWAMRLLVLAGGLALVLVALPYLVDWLTEVGSGGGASDAEPTAGLGAGVVGAGFLTLVAGVAAQLGHLLISSKEAREGVSKALGRLGAGARKALVFAAGGLVGPLLILLVVALAVGEGMARVEPDGGVDLGVAAVGGGILLAFALLYPFLDLTTWSLHPYYKRRLSSAFALKRVRGSELTPEEEERVEALDDGRGIAVERSYDELVSLSDTALSERRDEEEGRGREWPTLLVCAAANVSDPGATPPGRPVTSFTFSAHTVGGPLVGAVPTKDMEGAFEDRDPEAASLPAKRLSRRRKRDLTLPAAVAMSGAAISPSMGKLTPRPLTFLMALANVRLGVWVPNPRWVAAEGEGKSLPRKYGRPRPWYLLCELLGRNRAQARYLYVTDGGHYENLGLVELLRRGCSEIYCFDASGVGEGKAEFDALGDAISLARSELGVEIEFDVDPKQLAPDESGVARTDVAVGEIRFPDGPQGRLVYVRNSLTEKVPWDVEAHHLDDPRFPHNSTIDQLYTDQKFEAYRVLGERAGDRAVAAM
jgi:Patatin-like phospholipase